MSNEQTTAKALLCIRQGEFDGVKCRDVIPIIEEDARNWVIELDGERYLVSKTTSQIRGCWDSPWFVLEEEPAQP